jgi:hypothetical protein
MKNINFQEIIKQAFSLTWKNKFMWIFGFLVFLGSITSSINFQNGNSAKDASATASLTTFIQAHPILFVSLTVLLVIIIIALFLLKIIATTSIIKSANNITLYKQLSIWTILLESRKYLKKLFLLEIIVSIAMFVVVITLSIPVVYLFFLDAKVFAFFALAIAIIIFIPLLILAFYLLKYSYFYIVLGDFEIRLAIESAYSTIVKNFKESLLMGVVSIGLQIVFVFLCLLTVFATFIIFAPLGYLTYLLFAKIGAIILAILGVITLILFVLILFSWYIAFLQTVWLLFFQQISFEKNDDKEKITVKQEPELEIPTPEII